MTALLVALLASASPQGALEAAVRDALVEAARERLALGAATELEVGRLRPAEADVLRRGRLVSVVLPPGETGHGRVTARVTVDAGPRHGGVRETWVMAEVRARVPAVVATRRLARGDMVQARDVTLALRPAEEPALGDVALAVGRVTRHALEPGDAVGPHALELPTLIRRGDRVQARVSGPSFNLRAAGEALGRGAMGESVAVRVTMTGKVVYGRVTGPGEIEVSP